MPPSKDEADPRLAVEARECEVSNGDAPTVAWKTSYSKSASVHNVSKSSLGRSAHAMVTVQ
jgi:hypothetical protein